MAFFLALYRWPIFNINHQNEFVFLWKYHYLICIVWYRIVIYYFFCIFYRLCKFLTVWVLKNDLIHLEQFIKTLCSYADKLNLIGWKIYLKKKLPSKNRNLLRIPNLCCYSNSWYCLMGNIIEMIICAKNSQ